MSDTFTAGRAVTLPLRPKGHTLSIPLDRGVEIETFAVTRDFETDAQVLTITTRYASWWLNEETARRFAAGEVDPE
jgi:hypothetical protein